MNVFLFQLKRFLVPLLLTIGIELGVLKSIQQIFKKYNKPYLWLSLIAINIITNPASNFISSIINPGREIFLIEIGLEILIIFAEAGILFYMYKKEFNKFLILSSIINICSYGIGLLIFRPIWLY